MKLNKKVMFITALTLTLGAGVAALNNRNDANVAEAAQSKGSWVYAAILKDWDNNWNDKVYIHYWGGTGGTNWSNCPKMTKVEDNFEGKFRVYKYQINDGTATDCLFKVAKGDAGDKSTDQKIPADAKNMYYCSAWGVNTWIEYKEFDLTINYNGGTIGSATSQVIDINANGTNVDLTSIIPSRDGYAFKGWATTANATESNVALTHTVNKNATYYAVWEENSTAVTYKFVLGDQTINVPGTSDVLPEVPEFEGYQIVDSLEDMTYDEETTTYTINNYFQKVETKSSLRLSYTYEGQEPNIQDGFTRYYCETDKSNMKAYIWKDGGAAHSEWPGVSMTKLKGNIYYVDVPAGVYDSIIFTDGTGQTADLALSTTNNYYKIDGITWDYNLSKYSEITYTSVNNVGLRFGFAGVAKDFLHVNELETALKLKLSYVGTTGVNEKVVTINEEDIATVDGNYQYGYVLPMVASQYSTLAEDANVYNTEFTAQLIVEVDGVEYPMNEKTFSVASLADYYIANAASLGISSSKVEMINLLKTTYCA